MMKLSLKAFVAVFLVLILGLSNATSLCALESKQILEWKKISSIPDRVGFAGSFAGVHHGALIVAGGANFPNKRPWEGGTKVWYDSIFVLEKPNGEWKTGFKLPRPIGYGVSITHPSGVICIGGSDAQKHFRNVFKISWNGKTIEHEALPELPQPCANMCGALLGDKVYVAGGIETPDATNALKTFWRLDLKKTGLGWESLPPWPGQARMLAAAGARDDAFYLFGGTALHGGLDGKPARDYLRDAFCFTPKVGWKKIANLPRAAVASPSPTPRVDDFLLLLSGDDGAQVNVPPTKHRGFPREILGYDFKHDSWKKLGETPFALVTTPAVNWNQQIVIPGGEAFPGIRSTEIWAGSPRNSP